MGTPEEIASAVVFIGSDKVSYVIGAYVARSTASNAAASSLSRRPSTTA